MGYAVVAGSLVAFVEPLAAGSGIPEIKTYLNGIHIKGLLAVRLMHAAAAASLHLQARPLYVILLCHPCSQFLPHACFCKPAMGMVPYLRCCRQHYKTLSPRQARTWCLQVRTLVAKLTGVVFSIAAGLIAGKEGPFVHGGGIVGGGIGSMGSQ